jgi:mannosyltransferase
MNRQILGRGTLLLLLLLCFAVRISGLTAQSMWRDEVDALRFSQAPLETLVANFTRPGWNGPLFYVLLRYWVALTGQSAFALRYFSLCSSVLAVAGIYRLGRQWLSPLVGGLAALFMACSPYMVWYGQETKMYALLCALVLATLYLYHRALSKDDWRAWLAMLLLTWATIAVHIMGGLMVPLMVALFFVWWPVARAHWRQMLLVMGITILPMVAALPWVFPVLIRGGDIGHRFVSLQGMTTMMLHAFSRGIMPSGQQWPMGLALFTLLAGSVLWSDPGLFARLAVLWRGTWTTAPRTGQPEHAYVLALWTWMVLPMLGLYAISLRIPMFVDRYLIWIGPAFYLLAARGLDQIRRRSMVIFVLCLTVGLWFSGQGIVQQSSMAIKSDLRGAAEYVREHRQPEDLVLFHISYIRYAFEYYYGDSSPYADGIPTTESTTESVVDTLMRERTAGYNVVWLVLSEPEMWDRRGMTVAWLETHAIADMRTDLARVSIIRYRMLDSLS